MLLALLITCLLLFVLVLFIDNRAAPMVRMQIEIVGDTLMHTQRLAKAAPNAVGGNRAAFAEVQESRDAIANNLEALDDGRSRHVICPRPAATRSRRSSTSCRTTGARASPRRR